MRRIYRLGIFLFLFGLWIGALKVVSVLADEAAIEPQGEAIRYYAEWTFKTYEAPDFEAEITGSYLPQTVLIHEWREDGWALIDTYQGAYWAYLNESKLYLDRSSPIYDHKGDAKKVGHIDSQIVKVIERSDDWLLIETWKGEKWIDLHALKESVRLEVPSYNQRSLGYPTGCEIVATAMMINYAAETDVHALVSEMPRALDPNEGFRGNPATKSGFTIFPEALLDLTEEHLGNAQDMSGCEVEDLKRQLNDNAPVVVWINGLGFDVHAVCLTGYDEKGFYYNDPWTGSQDTFITYDSLYKIWDKPIYDKLYGSAYPTRKALSYTP